MSPICPCCPHQTTYNLNLSQDVTVSFDTPSSSYEIAYSEAVLIDNELCVLWKLSVPGDICKCDIGKIRATVNVPLPDDARGPIHIHNFVLGKGWNWEQKVENLEFITSKDDFQNKLWRYVKIK